MKYISRKLLVVAALGLSIHGNLWAQEQVTDKEQNSPVITYTANHPRYVLGGITVDEMKGMTLNTLAVFRGSKWESLTKFLVLTLAKQYANIGHKRFSRMWKSWLIAL